VIKGTLVGLRALEREDLTLLRDWRNIPDFRRNFREYRELNLDNQLKWFEGLQASGQNNFMFVIERLSDQKPLGACGLLYTNWIIRSADFSFYIGFEESYIDNYGYALDAAILLTKYGFNVLNLNKIWMELYEFDKKKLAFFLEQLSFKKDGKLRDNCFEDGRYWDSFIISLTRNDFENAGFNTLEQGK
jgi:RimJ/RimL family protein N-acetyltransferase